MEDTRIIKLGPALIYFFNNAKLNIYQGQISINLMDYFPTLKRGYAILSTIYCMMNNYMIMNGSISNNYIISDSLFLKAFSYIPPIYYVTTNRDKIIMQDAINSGLIAESMNSFQILSIDPLRFNLNELNNIVSINVEDVNIDDDYDVNYEHRLALEIFHILTQIKEDGIVFNDHLPLYDFVVNGIYSGYDRIIIENVISNTWIHLLYAIIIQDPERIKELLKLVDPRINNNEAYRLALKIGYPNIINIIRDDIVNTTMLQRQIATSQLEIIYGPSDVPQTVFNYGYNAR